MAITTSEQCTGPPKTHHLALIMRLSPATSKFKLQKVVGVVCSPRRT